MSAVPTLLLFAVVGAAVLAAMLTAVLVVIALVSSRLGGNSGGRGRRMPSAPYRGRPWDSDPPFRGGGRRDDYRPRAGSQRRNW